MSNFLMFVMITALFVHTFSNFLLGVYSTLRNKLAANPSVAAFVSSLEDMFGKMFASVWSWVQGLFAKKS